MPRCLIAVPLPALYVLVLLGMFAQVSTLHAQIDTKAAPQTGLPRPGLSPGDEDDPFRDNPGLRERLRRSRAADRQRRIVDDANRLVALTAEYRKALDAHGTPTDNDQKLLVQIEKLARDVKDRMRGM
ncbi:hypothetical protein [Terriglobus sp.]|uniref:hypothetical protein n=1 Tax=Terriglobus sp. TaxID=1889013 RepID=UPI003AFFB031